MSDSIKDLFSEELIGFLNERHATEGNRLLFWRGYYNEIPVGIVITFVINQFNVKLLPMKLGDDIGSGKGVPVHKTFDAKSNPQEQ